MFRHIPIHIGQPEIAAGVAVGELLVIQAKQGENRGVQIVNVHRIVDGFGTVFISLSVGEAALGAAAGHPHSVAAVVVVAAVTVLGGGGAAEFSAPDNQRVFEQAALF